MPDEHKLQYQLADTLAKGFTDESIAAAKKQLKNILYDLESDIEYTLKDGMAELLADWTQRMADEAINKMLEGEDETMRRYLRCQENGYTGRGREHPVIHGKLSELGAIALRKQIVDAHADLLKTQRILDLEDQVRSLVEQVNKEAKRADDFWEQLRCYQ